MSKLKGSRLESEIDRCRTECDWKRLSEILPAARAKNSGLEASGDLIEGELLLETFIESRAECVEPSKENFDDLKSAESFLSKACNVGDGAKSVIILEANLLLAKLHYYCAEYDKALKDVEKSGLESAETPFTTLRSLRIVAEAYAVKGFSLDALIHKGNKSQNDKFRMRSLCCFEKSAELTISYVQELEKTINSNSSHLLESTLERIPLLHFRRNICTQSCDHEGIEWYRHIMTSLGDKTIAEKLQQRLSRQLAEVLIRAMPEFDYESSHSVRAKSQSLRFYTGSQKNYFSPASRVEEILLLLFISEVLATKDVVLSRAEELTFSRLQSMQTAKSVLNLLALVSHFIPKAEVLSSLRQYELLAGIFEKSTKFANGDRYIWFQFALTLLSYGRWVRASRILYHCLSIERTDENALTQNLLCAQMEIEHLGQYDKAIEYAEKAIELSQGTWLSGRSYLLKAIAISLKADTIVSYYERKKMYSDALFLFEKVAELDPYDDLLHYYHARQLAIVRDLNSSRESCERSLELNPENVLAMSLLALLFTAFSDYKGALELVSDSLIDFPSNYVLLVLKLKLEARYGRVDDALSTVHELFYFWKRTENTVNEQTFISQIAKGSLRDVRSNAAHSISSRDAIAPVAPLVTAPLAIVTQSPLPLSSLTMGSTAEVTDGSIVLGTTVSEYGAARSTVSEGILSRSSTTSTIYTRFKRQANVWVELVEIFLDLGRHAEVKSCIEEACTLFPNSHQVLYLKGRLLAARAMNCSDTRLSERLRVDAKTSFLGALAIVPSHISSYRHLAALYRLEGNSCMAEKVLKDIIKIDTLQKDVWYQLGIILADDKRHEEALECFSVSSSLASTTPLLAYTSLPISFRSL